MRDVKTFKQSSKLITELASLLKKTCRDSGELMKRHGGSRSGGSRTVIPTVLSEGQSGQEGFCRRVYHPWL